MTIDLSGKRALVCGSTQGIGRAVAMALAVSGAEVILVARNEAALNDVRGRMKQGPKHDIICADFQKPDELREKLSNYLQNHAPVHILLNNTGGPAAGLAIDAASDAFEAAFRQHLICNQILVQAVVPGMKAAAYGRIVNIISTSVKQPIRQLGVSNTIRGAVASWAKTLATELGPYGITVNNVLPGATRTERLNGLFESRAKQNGTTPDVIAGEWLAEIPAGRFAEPEEIAHAVTFLVSPQAAYINGVNLPVDGGRLGCL